MFKKTLSLFKLVLIIIITIAFALSVIIAMFIKGKKVFYKFAKIWSKLLLRISNIKINIYNTADINNQNSYVYISNHSSLFDIPILLSILNLNTRIMYKEELEKIPIFGYCLKLSPFISVKRENKENALESFRNSIEAIKQNDSVIIFPEGTRSINGELGVFKKGAFLLALKSGKDIIPITIKDANKILPKGKIIINSTIVNVYIHNNIKIDNNLDTNKLINQVYNIINCKLQN